MARQRWTASNDLSLKCIFFTVQPGITTKDAATCLQGLGLPILPMVLPPAIQALMQSAPNSTPEQQAHQAAAAAAAAAAVMSSPYSAMMLPPSILPMGARAFLLQRCRETQTRTERAPDIRGRAASHVTSMQQQHDNTQ
jgi:hypothetical protein